MRYSQVVAVAVLALGMSALGATAAYAADVPVPAVPAGWYTDSAECTNAPNNVTIPGTLNLPADTAEYGYSTYSTGRSVVLQVTPIAPNTLDGSPSTRELAEHYWKVTACPQETVAPAPPTAESPAPAAKTTTKTTTTATTAPTTSTYSTSTTPESTSTTVESTPAEPEPSPTNSPSAEAVTADVSEASAATPTESAAPTMVATGDDAPTDPMLPIGIVSALVFAAVGGGYAAHKYLPKG